MGQKLPRSLGVVVSALPPKADIRRRQLNVRFGPKAAVSRCSKNPLSKASLFDHLVGNQQKIASNV
jgi:hypothetical protein